MKNLKNEPAINPLILPQRCLAKIRKGNGAICISLVVPGKRRCFNHGGAPGSGAQFGNQNAVKHGHTTKESQLFRYTVKVAIRETQEFLDFVNQ